MRNVRNAFVRNSKNLIPFPYYNTKMEKNGLTFSVDNDGTIIIEGKPTALTNFELVDHKNFALCKGEYYVSMDSDAEKNILLISGGAGSTVTYMQSNRKINIQSDNTVVGNIALQFTAGSEFKKNKVRVMLNKGTKALPYAPPHKISQVKALAVARNPANLIKPPYYSYGSMTGGGLTFDYRADGSIGIKGTVTSVYGRRLISNGINFLQIGKKYTLSLRIEGKGLPNELYSRIELNNYSGTLLTRGGDATFELKGATTKTGHVGIEFAVIGAEIDCVVYPMLNEGETAEPYFKMQKFKIDCKEV